MSILFLLKNSGKKYWCTESYTGNIHIKFKISAFKWFESMHTNSNMRILIKLNCKNTPSEHSI